MSSLRAWIEAIRVSTVHLSLEDSDEAFARLVESKAALKKLQPLLAGREPYSTELSVALRTISAKQSECVRASLKTSASNKLFGDDIKEHGHVVLLVLGCANAAYQKYRVAGAADMSERLAETAEHFHVVLSGGGVGMQTTEAQDMKKQWLELRPQDAARAFLLEEDSLDTVGNAIFSWCALVEAGVRPDTVLVVTSDFHAGRSLAIFRRVFACNVTVLGISTPEAQLELGRSLVLKSFDEQSNLDATLKIAVSELKSEHLSEHTMFSLPVSTAVTLSSTVHQVERGDICTLLVLLFSQHGLYTNNAHLRRKYLSRYLV